MRSFEIRGRRNRRARRSLGWARHRIAAAALLLATGCSSTTAPRTPEPARRAGAETPAEPGAIERLDFEDSKVAAAHDDAAAGDAAAKGAIGRLDFDHVEAISLLGQPLHAPQLGEQFRARQQTLLAEARADLEQRPDDPDAVIWVGRRTAYLGRYRQAVEIYSRGIEAHPEHAALYLHRGHRYITLRRLDDAIADLERATRLIAGTPDKVEPDGLPNARGIPTSTSHSNIWYHLGLAHYLKGDFEQALAAYRQCLDFSTNPDMLSATTDWVYKTLRRLGRERETRRLLLPFEPGMELIENVDYYQLLLMYKGRRDPARLLASAEQAGGVSYGTLGYGIGNHYLVSGDRQRAEKIFRRIVESQSWAAFGYIAAEAELARWQEP